MQYYNGSLAAIGAIFSAIKESHGIAVNAIFSDTDLPKYDSYSSTACPMCKSGQKVDALINSFGYSKI